MVARMVDMLDERMVLLTVEKTVDWLGQLVVVLMVVLMEWGMVAMLVAAWDDESVGAWDDESVDVLDVMSVDE